jgi:hypothetical protein
MENTFTIEAERAMPANVVLKALHEATHTVQPQLHKNGVTIFTRLANELTVQLLEAVDEVALLDYVARTYHYDPSKSEHAQPDALYDRIRSITAEITLNRAAAEAEFITEAEEPFRQ